MPPKIPQLPPEPIEAIEEAAAEWLVLKAGGLTPRQAQDLARWLELDPRNAEVLRSLEGTWDLMAEARPEAAQVVPFRRRGWVRGALAAAAVLVVGLGIWTGVQRWREPVVVTEVGGFRRYELPDGSVATLNTDSRIEVGYTESERRVALVRGEAHFEVMKDKVHPFIVSAGGVDVRAVGTAFNVRYRAEGVEVMVTEGKVAVAGPEAPKAVTQGDVTPVKGEAAEPLYLIAGERTVVSLAPDQPPAPVVTVAPSEIKQALAWQERRLEFEETPLALMVEEINRYNRTKLVIADPRLAGRTFGGSFPSGDYEAFVRLLEQNFGVVAERRSDEIRLRLP